MTQIEKFQELLDGEEIQYFDSDEIFRRNPPEELWQNIIPTLRVLDTVRGHFGKPILVNSTYRDPEYNKKVGGASSSLHLEFNAVDFVVMDTPHSKVWTYICTLPEASSMGIGRYDHFLHIDTRGVIGRIAPIRFDKRSK